VPMSKQMGFELAAILIVGALVSLAMVLVNQ
jgi:hypothetical protein